MMDDAALVGLALADPQQGVAAIYERYGTSLYNYCHSLLRSAPDAGDALQECFVTVLDKLGQLREPDKLRPWLYAIARNQCFKRHRHRDREQPAEDFEHEPAAVAESPHGAAELISLVWQATAGLSEVDRSVLELNIRHELDGEDLAKSLGVAGSKCSVMLHRAKARLRGAVGALLVSRMGTEDCPELSGIVGGDEFTPLVRKRVARHITKCDVCAETERTHRPEAYLALAPLLPIPAGVEQGILGVIGGHGTVVERAGTETGPPGSEPGQDPGGGPALPRPESEFDWATDGFPRFPGSPRRPPAAAVLSGAAVCVVLLLLVVLMLAGPFEQETTVVAGPAPGPTAARPQFLPTETPAPASEAPSTARLPSSEPAAPVAPVPPPTTTPTPRAPIATPVPAAPPAPAATTAPTATASATATAAPTPSATATTTPTAVPPPLPTTASTPGPKPTFFPQGPVVPPQGQLFVDNTAPQVVSFDVVCSDAEGGPFLLTVEVFDAGDSSPATDLEATWNDESDPAVPLSSIGANRYRAAVPRSELTGESIDFFVRGSITDNSGNTKAVDLSDDCFIAQ